MIGFLTKYKWTLLIASFGFFKLIGKLINIPLLNSKEYLIGLVVLTSSIITYRINNAYNVTIKELDPSRPIDLHFIVCSVIKKVYDSSKIMHFIQFEINAISHTFSTFSNTKIYDEFSGVKTESTVIIYYLLIGLTFIEGLFLNILTKNISLTLTYILTGIHIYTLVILIGQIRSSTNRKHIFTNDYLILRYGLFEEILIDWKEVKSIEKENSEISSQNKILKLALIQSISNTNVIVNFFNPNIIYLPFGIIKTVSSLRIAIDDSDKFIPKFNEIISNSVIKLN